MKLKNKKTGEVVTLTLSTNGEDLIIMGNDMLAHITKLSELKDYEDYEEPKAHYSITQFGDVVDEVDGYMSVTIDEMKQIGNYFETKKEAEKAVKKLKAWKRLKDKGFRFNGWSGTRMGSDISYIREVYYEGCTDDMDLLFGGEE